MTDSDNAKELNGFKLEKKSTEKNYYEVLTDEAVVVGPNDKDSGLEVTPLNCGILTFVDSLRNIVGVVHCSRFVDKEMADNLISTIENGFRERGGNLNEVEIEGYNFLGENFDTVLDSLKRIAGIILPIDSKLVMGTTIRVDKEHGEVRDIQYGANGVEIYPDDIKVWENIESYWVDEQVRQNEEQEEGNKLTNPKGHLIALQVLEVDNNTLEIHWVNDNLMPTKFSAEGAEAEMYKYLKRRFPNLKESISAGFLIDTDESGRPLAIGEIGLPTSVVKRLEEKGD